MNLAIILQLVMFAGGGPWAGRAPALRDSLRLHQIGRWSFGRTRTVAVDSLRHLVFMGNGWGVWVLDVSDSDHPVKISEIFWTPNRVRSLFYDANARRLYIAGGELLIVDLSNPSDPKFLSSYRFQDPRRRPLLDVFAQGNYVYVTEARVGLHILDVSDPFQPQELGLLIVLPPYSVGAVAVSGGYAYLAVSRDWDTLGTLRIADVSDPVHPQQVGELLFPRPISSIRVRGPWAYVTIPQRGLRILDLSDPGNPVEVGGYPILGDVADVATTDSLAYVVVRNVGLRVLDISDPANPVQIHFSFIHTPMARCRLLQQRLFVACGSEGLQIIDVANPQDPLLQDTVPVYPPVTRVAVTGSYAYLRTPDSLLILQVSNPVHPELVGGLSLPGQLRDLQVVDTLLFVAAGSGGLRVLNIADPEHPQEIGVYDPYISVNGVRVTGHLAVLSIGLPGLRIVDVSDPTNPVELGTLQAPYGINGLWVSDAYAFLALGPVGLRIVDISDPSSPAYVREVSLPGDARDVCVRGTYAYVSLGDSGLGIVDVSNPDSAEPVAVYRDSLWRRLVRVSAHGALLYVGEGYASSDLTASLYVLDISNPVQPVLVGYYLTDEDPGHFQIVGDTVYVAVGEAGLQILEFSEYAVEEGSAGGSPANLQATVVRRSLPLVLDAPARVEIWDSGGRLRWQQRYPRAGRYRIPLEGWPAGVYLIRIQGDRRPRTQRFLLLP